jgi:hypothetical protein
VFEQVCDAIRASMEETETPRVAVGLLHDGEEHSAGLGVTSLETRSTSRPTRSFRLPPARERGHLGGRGAGLPAIGANEREREPIDVDADEYLGTYISKLFDVELKREDGRLILVATNKGGFPHKDSPPQPSPSPATVSFYRPDRLFVTEGLPGEMDFVRAPDGSIAWFRVGGRIMARAEA